MGNSLGEASQVIPKPVIYARPLAAWHKVCRGVWGCAATMAQPCV